jgi:hypothetical protein
MFEDLGRENQEGSCGKIKIASTCLILYWVKLSGHSNAAYEDITKQLT